MYVYHLNEDYFYSSIIDRVAVARPVYSLSRLQLHVIDLRLWTSVSKIKNKEPCTVRDSQIKCISFCNFLRKWKFTLRNGKIILLDFFWQDFWIIKRKFIWFLFLKVGNIVRNMLSIKKMWIRDLEQLILISSSTVTILYN